MTIASIGYVAMEARDPAAWGRFAETVLGATAIAGEDSGCRIRLDARGWRIAVHPGEDGALRGIGWELRTRDDYAAALARLEGAGVALRPATTEECRTRGVEACALLQDPAGNPVELFWGPRVPAAPFAPSRGVGSLSLGHIVIGAPDLGAAERFYTGVLGLKVSDYIDFERAGRSYAMVFLHAADGRHHSLALVAGPPRINHLMVEVGGLDAVGAALDRVQRDGIPLRSTLGRHSNDRMVSFYAYAPNGVAVEVGCDGITIDDATWQVTRLETPSLWGHDYVGR